MSLDRVDELRTFVGVVDAGSFTKAARLLRLSTNAVSHRVLSLEERLGVRLLTRTTRALSVTEEGQVLYERARRVVEELEAIEAEVGASSHAVRGLVRLVIPAQGIDTTFLAAVGALLEANPSLSVQLRVTSQAVDVVADRADLALWVGKPPASSLISRRLGTLSWALAATPNYLDQHGRPRRPEDLSKHRCLRFLSERAQDVWRLVDLRGRVVSVPVQGGFEADDSRVLGDAVYAGVGIGPRPDRELLGAIREGRLERVLPTHRFETLELFALMPRRSARLPRVTALVTALKAGLAELA